MGKVIYREVIKDDYETIKGLIVETFGFNDFIKDTKPLDIALILTLVRLNQLCLKGTPLSYLKNSQRLLMYIKNL